MIINGTKNHTQINFNGQYQGIINRNTHFIKLPRKPVSACVYADRMMMNTFSNTMKSKDKDKLIINIEKINGENIFNIKSNPKFIKKHMPLNFRVFKYMTKNLQSEIFWKILKNENLYEIEYTITDSDLKNLENYFNKPKDYKSLYPEDKKIGEKIQKFKNYISEYINKTA